VFANIAIGNLFLVTLRGVVFDQRIMNTFFYRCSAVSGNIPIDEAQSAFLATTQWADLVDSFHACCPDQYTADNTWLQTIHPGRYVKYQSPQTGSGTAGDCHTANLAAVITRQGNEADRHNNGSLHIVAPDADVLKVTGGALTQTYLDLLQLLADEMLTNVSILVGVNTATFEPSLAYKQPSGVFAMRTLFQAYPQNTARVMRRRTVGLGI